MGFLDSRATAEQRPALEKLALAVFGRGGASTGPRRFETLAIAATDDGTKFHVGFGERGGFDADVLFGRDRKRPIVVENNTTWPVDRFIKGRTTRFNYQDSLGNRLKPGSKVLVPALIPCLRCQVCLHHPDLAALCLRPTYLGRSVGFAQPPHLWGGWADMGYVDCEANPGARLYQLPDDMPIWLGSLVEPFTTATARATFPPAFRCCIGRVGVIRS